MNCQYCHSKIFEEDRTCPQCGAPNENNISDTNYKSLVVHGGLGNALIYSFPTSGSCSSISFPLPSPANQNEYQFL